MHQQIMMPFGSKGGSGPLALLEQTLTAEKLAPELSILENLKVNGGPTYTSEWFADQIDEKDELYRIVQEYNQHVQMRLR